MYFSNTNQFGTYFQTENLKYDLADSCNLDKLYSYLADAEGIEDIACVISAIFHIRGMFICDIWDTNLDTYIKSNTNTVTTYLLDKKLEFDSAFDYVPQIKKKFPEKDAVVDCFYSACELGYLYYVKHVVKYMSQRDLDAGLAYAANWNRQDVVKFLLDCGADKTAFGNSALRFSAGSLEMQAILA
jgi:hypothetical protein